MKRAQPSYDLIFKCKYCKRTYSSKASFCSHLATKHRDKSNRKQIKGSSNTKNTVEVNSLEFFDVKSRWGGPTMILYDFAAAFLLTEISKQYDFTEYPLYSELYKIHNKQVYLIDYNNEHGKQELDKLPSPSVDCDIQEVDTAFAKYLEIVSKVVNKNYYRKVIRLVILYRECLADLKGKLEYGESPMSVPLISNEMVAIMLRHCDLSISKDEIIGLVLNLCWWFFSNNYTQYTLAQTNFI